MIGFIIIISSIVLATLFSILSSKYENAYYAQEYSGSLSVKKLKRKSKICSNINTIFLIILTFAIMIYIALLILNQDTGKRDGKTYIRTIDIKSVNIDPIILSHEDYTEYLYKYEEYVDNGYQTKYLEVDDCIICSITDEGKSRIEVYEYNMKYPLDNIFYYDFMNNISPPYVYEIYIEE